MKEYVLDAAESLREDGMDVTVNIVTKGQYVPGSVVSVVKVAYAGRGILDRYKVKDIDGSRIKTEDLRLWLSPELIKDGSKFYGIEISAKDEIVIQGVQYEIVSVSPIKPEGDIALYDVQLRT